MGIKVSREFIKVEIELVSLRVCKSLGSGSKVTSPVCAAQAGLPISRNSTGTEHYPISRNSAERNGSRRYPDVVSSPDCRPYPRP